MIMVGKVVVSIIWVFWMMAMSSAEGNPSDLTEPVVVIKEEYNPTYSSTFERVKKRGNVICGTNDEFPGFSQETWHLEDGNRWEGFDVDICRAVATAMFGDADAIEFTIVNGRTRFEFLIDGSIDVLSATTTFTFTRNVAKKLEFMPTTYYDGQGFIVRKTLGVSSAKQMEGARICFSGSGTAAKNIADFFELHGINYIPVSVKPQKKQRTYTKGVIVICMVRIGLVLHRTD